MFNASSSKFNSSTGGTLHFTRPCEVAPTLRQFHFQTSISNTSDSSSSLFDFRCSSSHPVPNGMKLMAISKISASAYKYNTVNQAKFNRSMLHRPPSHLLKRPCCWSQRKVEAAWASQTGWSCVSCWDLCHWPPSLSIVKHNTSERHIGPKPWKVGVFQ